MANPRRRIELTIRSEVLVVQRGGHEVILLYRPTNLFIDLLMAALVIYAHLLCNFSEADWRAPSSELKQATPLPIMVDNAPGGTSSPPDANKHFDLPCSGNGVTQDLTAFLSATLN